MAASTENEEEPLTSMHEMNMKSTVEHSIKVKESEIRMAAYQMWEKAGRPPGRDLQFWLDAEEQLRTASTAAAAKPVAHISRAESNHNGVPKAATVRLGPSRPKSAKAQQKVRRF